MKLKKFVKTIEDCNPIKVCREYQECENKNTECCSYDCENCEYEYLMPRKQDLFIGRADNTPLLLGEKKVKKVYMYKWHRDRESQDEDLRIWDYLLCIKVE